MCCIKRVCLIVQSYSIIIYVGHSKGAFEGLLVPIWNYRNDPSLLPLGFQAQQAFRHLVARGHLCHAQGKQSQE